MSRSQNDFGQKLKMGFMNSICPDRNFAAEILVFCNPSLVPSACGSSTVAELVLYPPQNVSWLEKLAAILCFWGNS